MNQPIKKIWFQTFAAIIAIAAIVIAAFFLGNYGAPASSPSAPGNRGTASLPNPGADGTKPDSAVPDNTAPLTHNSTGIPLNLPEGFSISIFAEDVPGARVLTYDPSGNLLVSSTTTGKIFAMPDRDGDGKADKVVTILEGLRRPHGMAFRCPDDLPDHPGNAETCGFYVAEADKVTLYEYGADENGDPLPANGRKIIDLNSGGRHHTVTLLYGLPGYDNQLIIASGSSCDVCYEEDWRRAKILIANADGSNLREFASGLRNAVFMATHPVTGNLWATEMGRDNLGDNLPPDEINIIKEGQNYGWPVCYGQNIHDTQFDKNTYIQNPCQEPNQTASHVDLQAHSAPLGLAFVPEEGWPENLWHNLLVAYHGSWNRSEKTGYKIARIVLDAQGNYLGEEDFITGWLSDNKKTVHGRPADILAQPGGTLFISDDQKGVVYRVTLTTQPG